MAIQNVALIGAGIMGAGVARNILKGGYAVAVYDINPEAVAALEADGARAATSAADAGRDADIAITVLPAPVHLEAAVFGEDGLAGTLREGAILIQQSTVDPAAVVDLARRLEPQGVKVLDAPMLRNPVAAAAGTLGFVIGGDEDALAAAVPIFDCMGESTEYLGPVGTGSALKLVNNMLNITILCAALEATALGMKSGLTLKQMVTAFSKTSVWTRHLATYPQVFEERDFTLGFMTALAHKDIRLAMHHAASVEVPLNVAHAAYDLMARAEAQGYGRDQYFSVLR